MPSDHFFTSDAFLGALADVYFPGAVPRIVACEDVVARVLVHRGKPVSDCWCYAFHIPPITSPGTKAEMRVRYLQGIVRRECLASEPALPGELSAPFIRWKDFETWGAYERFAASELGMRSTSRSRAEARMARDYGPVRFVPNDPDPEAFELALRWKADQFRRTTGQNYFLEQRLKFYLALRERGLLMISTLRAGDRIVAAQLSNHWEGRFLYRLPSYDRELSDYSPGMIHLYYLLKYSFESGDTEFDFNFGREPYKFNYATHSRQVRQVGTVPRIERWERQARNRAAHAAQRFPLLYGSLRAAEANSLRFVHRLGLR